MLLIFSCSLFANSVVCFFLSVLPFSFLSQYGGFFLFSCFPFFLFLFLFLVGGLLDCSALLENGEKKGQGRKKRRWMQKTMHLMDSLL